jgi:hypothetical protein
VMPKAATADRQKMPSTESTLGAHVDLDLYFANAITS